MTEDLGPKKKRIWLKPLEVFAIISDHVPGWFKVIFNQNFMWYKNT